MTLREIRIEEDLTFEFFFHTPTTDRTYLAPRVTFSEWKVAGSDWVC